MPDSRTILVVLGTRPEAIKMAPVIHALAARAPGIRTAVCVTDQHQELLEPMLTFFGIRPDWRLDIMRERQSSSDVAARILERIPAVFREADPAAVLVQGDTTTTFAAALAAFYARIPVGHVEAGLRTYRRDAPFPEELNRQMTSLLADWHFAPTEWARENLRRAGIPDDRIALTGNPVIDSLKSTLRDLDDRSRSLCSRFDAGRRLVLVTAHRAENFGDPLANVCGALRDIVERNPDVEIVYPVHMNPRVLEPVRVALGDCPRIHLLPPLQYWETVAFLSRCHLVLTDSGGIQEEAPSLGKPVLVLRDATERPEGVEAGTARLVGTDRRRILREAERLLHDRAAYDDMARAHNPYGEGNAGERIVEFLLASLGSRNGV
jgi:UDP-N-acetylglucosamine 2-epimerase (non-hydrolysing)